MRDEIVKLDQQAKSASQETRQSIVSARTEIRQQYEFDVKELQAAYQEYINSLEAEMARIDKNVQQADDQMSAAFAEQSGQVTQQMHAAYEQLQASYHDVVSKANAYITSTKAWLNDSSAETKAKVQSELDDVSHKSRQMRAEMVATYKAQQEALEEQIASLKAHAAKATGETKRELDEVVRKLQAAHEAATKRYEEAHDVYVAELNEHIDEMRTSVAQVGEESRERMIEAIEARQAQLEKAKQKLKERK